MRIAVHPDNSGDRDTFAAHFLHHVAQNGEGGHNRQSLTGAREAGRGRQSDAPAGKAQQEPAPQGVMP